MRPSYESFRSYGSWEPWCQYSDIEVAAVISEPVESSYTILDEHHSQAASLMRAPASASEAVSPQQWVNSPELETGLWYHHPLSQSWAYRTEGNPDPACPSDVGGDCWHTMWAEICPSFSPQGVPVPHRASSRSYEGYQCPFSWASTQSQTQAQDFKSTWQDDPVSQDPSTDGVSEDSSTMRPIRCDPELTYHADGLKPRRQSPRHAGDEYTAAWIRGDGIDREGWCGMCCTWFRLKDSAYWYHMHYTHGISCATGKPFDEPKKWRAAQTTSGQEVLCGTCGQWIYVARLERWKTPYYRHAYKCQAKNRVRRGSPITGISSRLS